MSVFKRPGRSRLDPKLTPKGYGSIPAALFDVGIYPAAIPASDSRVRGEVYRMFDSASVLETLEIMRFKGVRRLPTVDGEGQLVGIVTVDDLLEILAEELNELAKIVAREQSNESAGRR